MPSLESLKMIAPGDLVYPVSYLFQIRTPWGFTQQEVSVDMPDYSSEKDIVNGVGDLLWQTLIATAICRSCSIDLIMAVRWKQVPLAVPFVPSFSSGRLFQTVSPREESACIQMHTGHTDSYATRRFFLAGIPNNWHSDGLLNDRGWDNVLAHMQGVWMGMSSFFTGSEMQWLIAYPRVVDATISNISGVGFRRVVALRVCHHTEKAPELTTELWP